MKVCSSCKEEKDLTSFNKNKSQKDGLHNQCKSCKSLGSKKTYPKHKERIAEKSKEWYEANKKRHQYLIQRWYSLHPSLRREKDRRREARKKLAIPKWVNLNAVKDVYMEAEYFQLHVDHIVPLQSKLVCGLHWEGNLQLLSMAENSSKGNRFWPDMP